MDLSILGTISTGGSPGRPKGKKRKKNTKTEEDERTLSQMIFDRMIEKPNLKYKGKREGEAAIKDYKARKTRSDEKLQKAKEELEKAMKTHNEDPYVHYLTDLQSIPGGYKYLGGFLVKMTKKQLIIILPKGCSGETLVNWRIHYEEVLIAMKNEIRGN